ncbi:MAG: nucleotidyltransferase domain-containing protein [Thermoplasmataceae archaeon]
MSDQGSTGDDTGLNSLERRLQEALKIILSTPGSEKIKFVYLYGSAAHGGLHPGSDIDLCICYEADEKKSIGFLLEVLGRIDSDIFDIKLFKQLPLYVQIDVFKGRLLYSRDLQAAVYDVAYETISEYEDFMPRSYDYIGKEAIR